MEVLLLISFLCAITGVVLRMQDKAPIVDLFIFGVGIVLFMASLVYSEPSALDVYQGKTTLEITYRDSVAVDSTVVFKK